MSVFDDCRSVSCVDAAVMLGIPLRKTTGTVAWALCPIHGERGHPSLFLSADRGWYCYGCHRGGDAVRLYQDILGMEPLDAAHRCANDFGIAVEDYNPDTITVNARHLVSALHRRRDALRADLANQLCDVDESVQLMIHNNGMDACAEDEHFFELIKKRSALQMKLDQILEADDMELLEILKEYEQGR